MERRIKWIIVGAIVLIVVALICKRGEKMNETATEKNDEIAKWKKAVSSQRAFMISIPDGWKVVSMANGDLLMALSPEATEYRPGTPASISEMPIGGGVGIVTFSAGVSTSSHQSPKFTKNEKADFGPVDNIMGTLYSEEYVSMPLATFDYVIGEKDYLFIFPKGGIFYYVKYCIAPGEPNRLDLVEKVVKTMKFLK